MEGNLGAELGVDEVEEGPKGKGAWCWSGGTVWEGRSAGQSERKRVQGREEKEQTDNL